jgi:hypothetical protein
LLISALFGDRASRDLKKDAVPAIWFGENHRAKDIFEQLGLSYREDDNVENTSNLTDYLENQEEALPYFLSALKDLVLHADYEVARNFFNGIALNENIQTTHLLASSDLLGVQQEILELEPVSYDYLAFIDNWSIAREVVEATASPTLLINTAYNVDKVDVIKSIYELSGYDFRCGYRRLQWFIILEFGRSTQIFCAVLRLLYTDNCLERCVEISAFKSI